MNRTTDEFSQSFNKQFYRIVCLPHPLGIATVGGHSIIISSYGQEDYWFFEEIACSLLCIIALRGLSNTSIPIIHYYLSSYLQYSLKK